MVPPRTPIAYSGCWATLCAMYSVLMIMSSMIFFIFFGCLLACTLLEGCLNLA